MLSERRTGNKVCVAVLKDTHFMDFQRPAPAASNALSRLLHAHCIKIPLKIVQQLYSAE